MFAQEAAGRARHIWTGEGDHQYVSTDSQDTTQPANAIEDEGTLISA